MHLQLIFEMIKVFSRSLISVSLELHLLVSVIFETNGILCFLLYIVVKVQGVFKVQRGPRDINIMQLSTSIF